MQLASGVMIVCGCYQVPVVRDHAGVSCLRGPGPGVLHCRCEALVVWSSFLLPRYTHLLSTGLRPAQPPARFGHIFDLWPLLQVWTRSWCTWVTRSLRITSPSAGRWPTANHMLRIWPRTCWPLLFGSLSPSCCTGRRSSGRSRCVVETGRMMDRVKKETQPSKTL